jgi:hypothetical protein
MGGVCAANGARGSVPAGSACGGAGHRGRSRPARASVNTSTRAAPARRSTRAHSSAVAPRREDVVDEPHFPAGQGPPPSLHTGCGRRTGPGCGRPRPPGPDAPPQHSEGAREQRSSGAEDPQARREPEGPGHVESPCAPPRPIARRIGPPRHVVPGAGGRRELEAARRSLRCRRAHPDEEPPRHQAERVPELLRQRPSLVMTTLQSAPRVQRNGGQDRRRAGSHMANVAAAPAGRPRPQVLRRRWCRVDAREGPRQGPRQGPCQVRRERTRQVTAPAVFERQDPSVEGRRVFPRSHHRRERRRAVDGSVGTCRRAPRRGAAPRHTGRSARR